MRKYSALAPVLGLLLLASCEEKGPLINLTDVAADPDDTTYVLSAAPTAQARNVYIEEFTGVSCPNCPSGHTIVKSIQQNNPDRVVAVGLYIEGSPLTNPVDNPDTEDDFRSPVANSVNATIYDGTANGLPIAGIDRTKYNNVRLLDRALWASTVGTRLLVPTPLNLEATSDYNSTDSTLKVKLTASFNAQVTQAVYFAIGVVQDSIIDVQESGLTKIPDYQHDHVFRGFITSQGVNGIQLPFSNFYEAGRVFVRTINVPLFQTLRAQAPLLNSGYVKPGHCKIFVIAYHKNGDAREILQAIEVDML